MQRAHYVLHNRDVTSVFLPHMCHFIVGLTEIGIYRVSGLSSDILELKQAFDKSTTTTISRVQHLFNGEYSSFSGSYRQSSGGGASSGVRDQRHRESSEELLPGASGASRLGATLREDGASDQPERSGRKRKLRCKPDSTVV